MGAWKNTSATPMRGLVGRAASAAAFDLHRWAPSDGAARFVEHFWSVTWDLRDRPPVDSTVITFPSMHLTREWGTDGTRHGHPLPATLLHGVVERVFHVQIRGRGAVVGARFRPGGFVARFGGDAAALTGRVESYDSTVELVDDVTESGRLLDEAIAAHTGPVDPTYSLLCDLVDRIRDDDGLHRAEQVLSVSPWSVRTTQRVFRRYVGVPVKWVLCRYRLQQAALEIETCPATDLADLAVRLGWYDQAHFTNDFRSMLGYPPGEYAARHAGQPVM